MTAILLTVAYDGAPFSGWALQRDARTVAGELLGAIQAIDPAVRELRGASRTDAGVHARGQLAAFDTAKSIPPKGWALGLAAHLPAEIGIRRAALAPEGCQPRHESIRKHYRYLVLRDVLRDPLWEGRAWRVGRPLDLEIARTEAASLVGTHDFAAFRSSGDQRVETVRTIERVEIAPLADDARVLALDVVGTAFLYNMVRIIAGTLIDAARRRRPAGVVASALASRERGELGVTAPAHGLYLESIEHRIPVVDEWPERGPLPRN
jgi:tRNA pseudouridine38-40 synthase